MSPSYVITPIDSKNWRLEQDLVFYYNNKKFVVPKGFVTDLASIPTPFRWLWKPHDPRWVTAAVIHDYLYTYHGIAHKDEWVLYTKEQADLVFLEVMLRTGNHPSRAFLFWFAVHKFANKAWEDWDVD